MSEIVKFCTECKTTKPLSEFHKCDRNKVDGHHRTCKLCFNAYNRSCYRKRVSEGYVDDGYESREKLRDVIFAAYGNSCTCCGEVERRFLTIEHIGGGGRKHLRETGNGYRMMLDIIKQGFPRDKYTVLCIMCNFGTRYGHTCPHQEVNMSRLMAGMAC